MNSSKMDLPKPRKTIENLPYDIFCNIFSRLQLKVVARLKCVSKPFNALLSHSSPFVKSLVDYSVNNSEVLLIFRRHFSFGNKPFMVHASGSPHLELPKFIKLPVNAPSNDALCCIVGSVNGLICFYYHTSPTYVIYIWNPSLGALAALPPSNDRRKGAFSHQVFFKFGFDPKTNDYKVMKLTFRAGLAKIPYRARGLLGGKKCVKVELYSMRKGSWEVITTKFPSHVTRIYDDDELCMHGNDDYFHWLGYLGEEKKVQTIVSFDLSAETFNEISLPHSLQGYNENRSIVLGFMDRKLCLMSQFRDREHEVWVKDMNSVTGSWVRHHVICDIHHPSSDESLLKEWERSLALYDLVAAKVNSFKIMAIKVGKTKIIRYVESLVWVTATKLDGTSKKGQNHLFRVTKRTWAETQAADRPKQAP